MHLFGGFELVNVVQLAPQNEIIISEEVLKGSNVVWMSKPSEKDETEKWPWKNLKQPKKEVGWNFTEQILDTQVSSVSFCQVCCRKVRANTEVNFSKFEINEADTLLPPSHFLGLLSIARAIDVHIVACMETQYGEVAVIFLDWLQSGGWSLTLEKFSSSIRTNYDYTLVTPV